MVDWTIIKLLTWTESYFGNHDIDSPRLTAEILLASSLGMRRLDLYLQHDRPLEKHELEQFKVLIKRRVAREPVAYITGERGFFDSDFRVRPGVLIPRPDTEILVETAIGFLAAAGRQCRVLELGVGSGAIILSLAKACPSHAYFASDLSPVALAQAGENANRIPGDCVSFFRGRWLDAVRPGAGIDLILSNPPYIPGADIQGLAPEVRDYEPRLALDGGPDGLDAIRSILAAAAACMAPGGRVLLEMGFDQKPGVEAIADGISGLSDLEFIRDLAGHHRLISLKKTN